ncbi:MAG: M48 family metalloprotease [Thermoanaerobaculia bacterium]|nr:M48 family metalloprotease [Thermoanaerobaculia bacterium]
MLRSSIAVRILISRVLILLSLAGALGHPAGAQKVSNPDLFGKTAAAAQRALDEYGVWEDPEAQRRLQEIGYRLAGHSGYQDFPFSFFLIDMREPNAFALPGGQIFVTRGMYELGLSDDQLAGLLGHEIAHVTQQHGIRMQRRATLLNILSQAVMVGVIMASDGTRDTPRGVPYDPRQDTGPSSGQQIQGAAAASMVLGELLLRSYSREFEDEADEEGQRIAAAAGFAPGGAADLFRLMEARLPQSRKYGYWRTHPFFTDRVRAASARGESLASQDPHPVDRFRAATQATLLAYEPAEIEGADAVLQEKVDLLLDRAALAAWPRGETAERLREKELDRLRAEEMELPATSRDYGRLIRAYEEQEGRVAELTPESPFLAELRREKKTLTEEVEEIYPKAREILEDGVYQTRFLETFLSNFPQAPEVPEVAMDLARAYSRMGRHTDAVARYLQAWHADPEGETGTKAIRGLQHLAGNLDQLAALQQIANQLDDPEIERVSRERLERLTEEYDSLANGAEYLERFPDGPFADAVAQRQESLARRLYGEVILYQEVGDSVKALQRIQKILDYAPFSSAAEELRGRVAAEES